MNTPKPRHSRLGRGLSSLVGHPVPVPVPGSTMTHPAPAHTTPLPTPAPTPGDAVESPAIAAPQADTPTAMANHGLVYLSVTSISPNPHQPRQRFDPEALQHLADSIRAQGLMQPVIVRAAAQTASPSDPAYELVAGERRWRAAQMAGLDQIPAIVRDLDDRQISEWALVENLQREDLNPMERATAFQHLLDQFHLAHEDIAQRVGVDRSTITNTLRLLTLPPEVQELVRQGMLSLGQAKAIAGLSNPAQQIHLAKKAVGEEWSVRRLEEAVRHLTATAQPAADPKTPRRAAHLADLEKQIGQQLNTKVRVRPGRKKGSGTLTIEFYSLDQFDSLLERMGVQPEQ